MPTAEQLLEQVFAILEAHEAEGLKLVSVQGLRDVVGFRWERESAPLVRTIVLHRGEVGK